MLGNIRDHRTDPTNPRVDAVFEPSIHDDGRRADGVHHFSYDEAANSLNYFAVTDLLDTTLRTAVLHAETRRVLGQHRYEAADAAVTSEAGEEGETDVHHALGL